MASNRFRISNGINSVQNISHWTGISDTEAKDVQSRTTSKCLSSYAGKVRVCKKSLSMNELPIAEPHYNTLNM